MTARVKLVRANLDGFAAEGHLYRVGDQHFVVFTGQGRHGWAVCETTPAGTGFGRTVVKFASTRDEAIKELADAAQGS